MLMPTCFLVLLVPLWTDSHSVSVTETLTEHHHVKHSPTGAGTTGRRVVGSAVLTIQPLQHMGPLPHNLALTESGL